jgi:hypothetical protein
MKFGSLAERQIRKASAEGKLKGLAGEGKPLPDRPNDSAEAAGLRIMAEAGVVPKEFELKKAVDAQLRKVKAAAEGEDRKREMAKLADLQLRLAIEQEARRRFYGTG